jgi:glycerophosphoryl diester phosphodiesterase
VAVLAHRGASRAERENTLVAFRRAAEMGADAVELDVRRSADGHLVVHHDPRLADGRNIVETARRDLPEHVPSLAEALDACAGMWVNVEIKNDPTEPDFDSSDTVASDVAAALLGRGDPQRYLVSSFRRETIDALRRTTALVPTAWLTVGIPEPDTAYVLDSLVADGHCAVHPWVATLTKDLVDACHQRGLGVNSWTCDDPQRMAELVSWGIDGICTNVPDLALDVLRGR